MKSRLLSCLFIALAVPVASWASALAFQGSGNVAGVTPTRDAFRLAIGGGVVAGANGSFGGVRREINWDGAPDSFSAPNNLPANFFNSNSPRGVVFSTPGTGFQVSANAGVAPVEFDNLNPSYSSLFAPFSPQRLFTSLGSNVTDVNFFVPGTNVATTVTAFGVMFSDVDLATSTSITYFDQNGNSLGTFNAIATPGNEMFSFLGVLFNAGEQIGRVRITSGNSALGAGVVESPTNDLVVMDDFIYSEPLAAASPVPEPGTLALFGSGFAWLAGAVGRTRKK